MSQVQGLSKRKRAWVTRAWVTGAGAVALLMTGVGCSATSASTKSITTRGPAGTLAPVQSGSVTISARDNSFVAENVTVKAGSTVVWRNDGRNDHNILPVGDTPFHLDTAGFGPKATYEFATRAPGTYRYYCSIHGTSDKGMIGTVQVVPA